LAVEGAVSQDIENGLDGVAGTGAANTREVQTVQQDDILTQVEEGVATITLNRPEAMNAFSDDMREQLLEHLSSAATRGDVGCVVITGAGKAFCAGGDIASMAALQEDNDPSVVARRIDVSGQVLRQLREMPQPVVAAVNGAAAGAGMNLALACDMRLASEAAIFAESFVRIGLVPDWGGFSFLSRLAGTAKAMELMMSGDRITADEAGRLGLVNKVIGAADFAAEVTAFARRLAAGPRAALAAIKQGVYLGVAGSAAEVLAYERDTQERLFLSADAREGMRAFLDKRRPEFGQG
jgi:2-(1,2-epoxy-1,2-dihydrophenyl)acetyl-CoA isomerase